MTLTQENITTIINALAILAGAVAVWLTGRKVSNKVDEDKAETTRASAKVDDLKTKADDLKTKADDIHNLVNHRSDAQEEKIKVLLDALLELSEKRVADQKEATAKVMEATSAVQDTTKQVTEAMKSGVPVIPIERRRDDKNGKG